MSEQYDHKKRLATDSLGQSIRVVRSWQKRADRGEKCAAANLGAVIATLFDRLAALGTYNEVPPALQDDLVNIKPFLQNIIETNDSKKLAGTKHKGYSYKSALTNARIPDSAGSATPKASSSGDQRCAQPLDAIQSHKVGTSGQEPGNRNATQAVKPLQSVVLAAKARNDLRASQAGTMPGQIMRQERRQLQRPLVAQPPASANVLWRQQSVRGMSSFERPPERQDVRGSAGLSMVPNSSTTFSAGYPFEQQSLPRNFNPSSFSIPAGNGAPDTLMQWQPQPFQLFQQSPPVPSPYVQNTNSAPGDGYVLQQYPQPGARASAPHPPTFWSENFSNQPRPGRLGSGAGTPYNSNLTPWTFDGNPGSGSNHWDETSPRKPGY